MTDVTELDKIFDERNIQVLLINLRHATHIPSFHIFNLQHYGDHSGLGLACSNFKKLSLTTHDFTKVFLLDLIHQLYTIGNNLCNTVNFP